MYRISGERGEGITAVEGHLFVAVVRRDASGDVRAAGNRRPAAVVLSGARPAS